jgi:hypothetical protein
MLSPINTSLDVNFDIFSSVLLPNRTLRTSFAANVSSGISCSAHQSELMKDVVAPESIKTLTGKPLNVPLTMNCFRLGSADCDVQSVRAAEQVRTTVFVANDDVKLVENAHSHLCPG